MCLQDLKIGYHKYTQLLRTAVAADGQRHPGTQSNIVAAVAPWSTPRLFLPANPLRVALRLVLASPGIISTEDNEFVPAEASVFGFIYNGPSDQAAIIPPPIYALLSVRTYANMTDMVRIEDVGTAITNAFCFQAMLEQEDDFAFGGFTVWDIQTDRVIQEAISLSGPGV